MCVFRLLISHLGSVPTVIQMCYAVALQNSSSWGWAGQGQSPRRTHAQKAPLKFGWGKLGFGMKVIWNEGEGGGEVRLVFLGPRSYVLSPARHLPKV